MTNFTEFPIPTKAGFESLLLQKAQDVATDAQSADQDADRAEAARDASEAWAESPTPPDPDDAGSKSSKTWAGEAQATAETLGTLSELEALAERGETAETGAVTAQGLAEAALDGITLVAGSTGYQPDVATAEGALADGDVFWTVEGDEIVQYEIVSGSAVEIEGARYPTSAAVQEIRDDMRWRVIPSDFCKLASAFVDESDLVASGILHSGESISEGAGAKIAPAQYGPRVYDTPVADLYHHQGGGQSNATGFGHLSYFGGASFDLIASGEVRGFSTGIQYRTSQSDATLIPLRDFSSPSDSGIFMNAVLNLDFYVNGQGVFAGDPERGPDAYTSVASLAGAAGQNITNLSKGGSSGRYEDAIWQFQEASRLATLEGNTHVVVSYTWIQGEGNWNTPVATYKAAFRAMMDDYYSDVANATGQDYQFPAFVVALSSAHSTTSDPAVRVPNLNAQAMFEMMHETPDKVTVAAPTYAYPHGDPLHLSAFGKMQIGKVWAKALYHRAYRGEDWRPLHPISITRSGARMIIVRLHVPHGPIVIDTEQVSDPGDYGFVVEDDNGDVEISSVEIAGPDFIKITLAADVVGSVSLAYAYYAFGDSGGGGPNTGMRGNIRDSDTHYSIDGTQDLQNWMIPFKLSLPYSWGQEL